MSRLTLHQTKEALAKAFVVDEFPRSAKYHTDWLIENMMGRNVLLITRSLAEVMDLKPEARSRP